jgi:Protein of unknown function (DUF1631)
VDVLSHTMATGSPDEDEQQAMMATVDDLIHSLQKPASSADRDALRQALPGLIQRLQRGMSLIGLPPAQQSALLDELMACHSKFLLAAVKPAKPAPVKADDAAAELVRQMREEMTAADQWQARAKQPDVMDTNVGSLPTVPMNYGDEADETPRDVQARPDWIDTLEKGNWCKLFLQGQWTTAHLLWISANRQFYMFTSNKAGGMHSLTRRALERLRAEGLATSLADRSLMQRAVDSMLQDLDD